jgi:HTH-type transcriptional regulator / antitoxin HigA
MPLKPIRTRADHDRALAEIERLMGAKRGSPQADRLEVLAALVAAYEAIHDPIGLPEPIAALLGSRSLASAILNRKRPMSLSVIRKLSSAWDLPTDILVQPYRLQGERSPRAA